MSQYGYWHWLDQMQHLHCNSDVTIGANPSLVFFGAQSVSKLDSSSAAMLVISSSEANSSFSFSMFCFTSQIFLMLQSLHLFLLRSSECFVHTTRVTHSWSVLVFYALRRETPIQYPCCSRERLWVVEDLKGRYRNGRNEWMRKTCLRQR